MPGRQVSPRKLPAMVAAAATVAGAAVALSSPATAAGVLTVTPAADTFVHSDFPSANFGTSNRLAIDGSPQRRAFVKFTVSGLTAAVTGAKLRIHTVPWNSGSDTGGTWRSMSDTTWSETGTTWDNQPAIDGATVATLGSVNDSSWYEIDVTGVVTGNGTYSFGGESGSNDGAFYDSRESLDEPELVITTGTSPSPPAPSGDPVLVGAGDISDAGSGDSATAALLDDIPGTVFTTGDSVYPDGELTQFLTYYDPTWGRHQARTRPVPGNHDYRLPGAPGYFTYFGTAAGDPAKGYYSYNLGSWHVVALNSNIARDAGSAQEQWLRADLAASSKPCTVAYWHHPRFTSGADHDPDLSVGPLVEALYDYGAELVVTGHNHNYERFAPMDPDGRADAARGIREFVAGTGGASHYGFGTTQPNSEVRNGDTFGVLKLTLHANSYDWRFVPVAGKTFTDSGSGTCH